MRKEWKDMTVDEKLDALRDDIQRVFNVANSIRAQIAEDEKGIGELFTRLEKLEKKA